MNFIVYFLIYNKLMLIAHRGYSDKYVDNSEESFREAIRSGFDMIELDINICKSGELVIFHDTLIDGINVNDYDLHTLYNKYGIITLDFYFKNINTNIIKTYIDIKGNDDTVEYLCNYFLNINKEINMELIFFASFNMNHLDIIQNKLPAINVGLITSNKFNVYELEFLLNKYTFFAFHWECFDNKLYTFLHNRNKLVFLYTCHNHDEYTYITNKFKFDGLVSNICVK